MAPTGEESIRGLGGHLLTVTLADDPLKNIELPGGPPSGFDHLSATHDELLKHGLPPPPEKTTCPDEFHQWEQIFAQAPVAAPVTLKPISHSHAHEPVLPAPGQSVSGHGQSGNWSGAVVNTGKPEGGFKFKMVSASWNVSRPCPPNSARTATGWNNGDFQANTWVGMDGYNMSKDVLRAGTAQRCVTTDDGAMEVVTYPWIGWYPSSPVEICGLAVSPGDLVTTIIGAFQLGPYWGSSPSRPVTKSFVFLCNRSTCTYFSAIVSASQGTSFQGDSAEWIVQCQTPSTMPYLGSTFIYNCWAIAQNEKSSLRMPIKKDLKDARLTDIVLMDGSVLLQAVKENNSVLGIFGQPMPREARVLSKETPRIVVYHQTEAALSPLVYVPVATGRTRAVTHVNIAAFHLNEDKDGNVWVTLNDDTPDSSVFDMLWKEVKTLQVYGIKVLGMLGGAAGGTFSRLDTTDTKKFEQYYGPIKEVVDTYKLDGLDLDVEEPDKPMSQAGINQLIDRLSEDFGDAFIITLAPVASALRGKGNLSGFSYKTLEEDRGSKIAWYNAQFYNGWGSMNKRDDYDAVVAYGFKAERVVAGVLTNSKHGNGYVDLDTLKAVLPELVSSYPDFGGVAGWEYYLSKPQQSAPWDWAQTLHDILNSV
ncbi:Glycoside hydrolase superfamily [Hyaloscypha variabilis]